MEGRQRKRSVVWSYFSPTTPGNAMCSICHKDVRHCNNTSNLFKHLKSTHPFTYQEAERRNDANQKMLLKTSLLPSVPQIKCPSAPRKTVKKFKSDPDKLPKAGHITESLIKMIVSDLTPVSIVENAGFRHFVKVLDPSYHIPDKKSLVEEEIPQLYEKVQTTLKQSLEYASSVVLTTDMWTSNTNESYLTVWGHFVDQNWKMETCNLLTAPLAPQHTADDISELLLEVSNDWGIATKVHAVVTNNKANMISAVKKCQWEHVMCFAHTLNSVVKDAIKADAELTPTLEKCCEIVAFFHQCRKASDMLKEVQRQLQMPEEKLIKAVETRWTSVLDMLKKLSDQQQAVVTALCLSGKSALCLTEEEWSTISQTIKALKPFDEATQEVLGEQLVTVSKVLPLVWLLQKATTSAGLHNRLASMLATQCKQHFQNLEHNFTIEASTILDPRFKSLVFIDARNVEIIKSKLISEMQSLCSFDGQTTSSEQSVFIKSTDGLLEVKSSTANTEHNSGSCSTSNTGLWQEFDISIVASRDRQTATTNPHNEMSRYMEERLIPRSEDPLLWWKNNAEMYPLLSKVAKKYLGTVGTSVPAERLLSEDGETVNQKRSWLEPENINMLLFLNSNLHLE
ncbi:zinc finger BED domain-containing protein 1-like [Gouania willdenowi]|uniref:Zinc finger BED domain-containing protein 1-like n=1 Tax=Gouania willdenowi TaxID=441366 RepID=A0A8C5GZA6_GOUWI|nr:zinc finger BED domain-containing protein 1-like [Gouania willdenowi]